MCLFNLEDFDIFMKFMFQCDPQYIQNHSEEELLIDCSREVDFLVGRETPYREFIWEYLTTHFHDFFLALKKDL